MLFSMTSPTTTTSLWATLSVDLWLFFLHDIINVQAEPGLSDQQRLLLGRLAPGAGARPGQAPGAL